MRLARYFGNGATSTELFSRRSGAHPSGQQRTTVRGRVGRQRKPSMTMCFAPIARARSAWRRRGMSRDPSLEQGIADPLDMTYHGGVSYHGGYYGRCIKYAAGGSPNPPERDDSPKAMFRKMDGAALGSGAAAGAEAVLPGGDACSSSLTRSIRPPAASTGELRSLSTTRTVAVGPADSQRTDGIQVAAVVREVALPVDGRERRPSTLLGTHYALELKRRESQGRLKLEATGRQQAMRQAAAIAAARGRAMEGDRCGSPQVFRESSGKQAEICGLGVREAARSQGMKAISALWPEVQARADLLAPQILQELTDAAQQPYRSPSPLHSVANQTPPPATYPVEDERRERPAKALWRTVGALEHVRRPYDAVRLELEDAVTQKKLADTRSGEHQPEHIFFEHDCHQLELPALAEKTARCPELMRIEMAQFPWPRSFSGRLLGGAVQLNAAKA